MTANTDPTPAASIAMFTIDCADPAAMADFYAPFLGLAIAYQDENAVMLSSGTGPALGFGKDENYRPPSWPDVEGNKRFHLDLRVDDLATAEARAVELGATVPEHQPGETWRVLLDPTGHPFCLALWQ